MDSNANHNFIIINESEIYQNSNKLKGHIGVKINGGLA